MSLLSRIAVEAARGFGILSSTDKTKVSASYLAVAGGGAGGGYIAGTAVGAGGGAGGYQTSTFLLSTLNTYSIAVGAGGSGVASTGNNGSNSIISGTGITTVTSTGGGGGGCNGAGSAGGSGGGGGGNLAGASGGAGTSGQGNNGGNSASPYIAGGGGGANAVGSNSTATNGGNGGNGTASSISGSSVTYSGGGGGAGGSTSAGSGGTGGGGAGNTSGVGAAGTANLGGGGGGSGGVSGTNLGGAGGSGVVIISYTSATPLFVGGTLTTSGGNQIHTFTSSGTLSPLTPVTASYLVVAGGAAGGAGYGGGGGGGAGGLLSGSTTIYSGATYVVTVGAGGAGNTSGSGASGTNSVLSGTGLTTVTSTGGGGGAGGLSGVAATGGSGGGGGYTNPTGAAGTSGQGNSGGNSNTAIGNNGGGGGGASSAGTVGTSGGTGGSGSASSISGSSITYAGGGGGGGTTISSNNGGSGGGGGGGYPNNNPGSAGTPSLGGGGGGGSNSNTSGGNGGSGIVIISYAGSQVFNGGLVTSSGGNTIHTFTATGALTPLTNNLNNSLRFRSSASAYLSRTPTVTSNQKTWTWSAWVKRGTLSTLNPLFDGVGAGTGSAQTLITFTSTDTLRVYTDNATSSDLQTTQVFRDPSAWYHIVIAFDTTQATAANRVKIYVNGNQITAFGTSSYPAQNLNTAINLTNQHNIGKPYDAFYFDGYMTDVTLVDGQQLEPYYFGNNDANQVWKPIKYTGTYGTNGFYLTFGNTTSTTTLGYDSSPNGNNWTTNNISLTAGTTYDAMLDVPTNTSATVANYPTLNPINKASTSTISNANLGGNSNGSTWNGVVATMEIPSTGKWYWEVTASGANTQPGIVSNTSTNFATALATYPANGFYSYTYYASNGSKVAGPSNTQTAYGATYTNGDVIGIALDMDAGTLTFYKNNSSQGTAFTGLTDKYLPYLSVYDSGVQAINFGQRPFSYTPPSGYVALNTYNLPTPTILQGNKYMDATLYTGRTAAQVIVNQAQFKPDFVWVKNRSHNDADPYYGVHLLFNSTTGVGNRLMSQSTASEAFSSQSLTAFNSNGFSIGTDVSVGYSGDNFVGWQWKANGGTTSSNTSGSITSTVQADTTAGFSIVTYTGTGANATVGHGLGVAPKMVIVKIRSGANDWFVWHTSLTSGAYYLNLNATSAQQSNSVVWNSTIPTSSVFSLGTSTAINGSGSTYVAYCWADVSGFSKAFSYTGNGSNDGVFTYLGFTPKFIIIKNASGGATSSLQGWIMIDTSRSTYNQTADALFANNSNASNSGTSYAIDILSNGFKTRGTDGAVNESSATYIGMAFASNPFKNSNAR